MTSGPLITIDEEYLKRIWHSYIAAYDKRQYRKADKLKRLYYKALEVFKEKQLYYAALSPHEPEDAS